MNSAVIAQRAGLAFLVMGAIGVFFGWMAWYVSKRWGDWGVGLAWAIGALLVTALMTFQIHRTQTALGFTPAQQQRFSVFPTFLPMWATALGAVALTVRQRIRAGAARFTVGIAGRCLSAWLLGVLVLRGVRDPRHQPHSSVAHARAARQLAIVSLKLTADQRIAGYAR